MKSKWTKEEVINELKMMQTALRPTQDQIDMVMYVERLFYNKHTADIRKRQSGLTKLWQDGQGFVSFWNGLKTDVPAMFPGCRACLYDSITHIRHSQKCTQNCDFCYYADVGLNARALGKGLYEFSGNKMSFTLDETKLLIDRQIHNFSAVGWLQKEPLEELDAIEPIMRILADKGMHQYMYTNGIRASYAVIDKLSEWGLNELRFNLMSTNFSDEVINRMGYARTKLQWVGIESPIFSRSYALFVEKRKEILSTSIDQINIPELQIVHPNKLLHFKQTEGPVYKHRRGYVSPISSRHYAYDLIEMAEKEKWNIIINDCSNDTKFFRGARANHPLGFVDYKSNFELPFGDVIYLAEQVLEDGVVYEFF